MNPSTKQKVPHRPRGQTCGCRWAALGRGVAWGPGAGAHVHAKSLQSCPTLWDPVNCSPPGPSLNGIGVGRCKLVHSNGLITSSCCVAQETVFSSLWYTEMEKNVTLVIKNPPANAGASSTGSIPGRQGPWRREGPPTPALLPGESHGQRRLAGYGPRGHRKSDATEAAGHLPVAQGAAVYTLWYWIRWKNMKVCICVQLGHFAVQRRLAQLCKSTIFQF